MDTEEVELQLPGYDLHTNVTSDKCKRGVLIYAKENLKASPSPVTQLCEFSESIWCEIALKGSDILMIDCIYRSPSSTMENNIMLNTDFKKVCQIEKYTHIIVCGDFKSQA